LAQDPSKLVSKALAPFIEDIQKQFDEALKEVKGGTIEGEASKELWKRLMAADHLSTRQYLAS
jgi:hypothetical protein